MKPIIDRVLELFAVVAHTDEDGRQYGMSYVDVLAGLRQTHPDANTSVKTLATYAQYVKRGDYTAKLARMQLTIPTFRLKSGAAPTTPPAPRPDELEPAPDYECSTSTTSDFDPSTARRARKPRARKPEVEPAH